MKNYQKPDKSIWNGRRSDKKLYMHEKIQCINLNENTLQPTKNKSIAFLGYACDEGVKRNNGRIGAAKGPNSIRKMLASLANHLPHQTSIFDVGNIYCNHGILEKTQAETTSVIYKLLDAQLLPIVLGGGHDLAYAHYNGIKKKYPGKTIGIINLDAHFDLRKVKDYGNSGTPFFQIASENKNFAYLCLGIQKAANNRELFDITKDLGVHYILNTDFTIENKKKVTNTLHNFIKSVDLVYLTIDMDGFSSSYAPGVSAPSPVGFLPAIAMHAIQQICESNKIVSCDLVETNPLYDIDYSTARLAARIAYMIADSL